MKKVGEMEEKQRNNCTSVAVVVQSHSREKKKRFGGLVDSFSELKNIYLLIK